MRSGEHLPGGVEALPFGLLAAFAEEKEIQITEAAEGGFQFRTAEPIEIPTYFKICFYEGASEKKVKSFYRELRLEQFEMEPIEVTHPGKAEEDEEIYFVSYVVRTEQKDYQQAVCRLIGSYGRYVRLKLEGDDAALAEAMTGYPAEKDEEYCASWEEQKDEWKKAWEKQGDTTEKKGRRCIPCAADKGNSAVVCSDSRMSQETASKGRRAGKLLSEIEIAVSLDRRELYQAFLEKGTQTFFRWYCEENGLSGHWLSSQTLGRIYIGNAFCPLLAPEEHILFALMDQADEYGLEITLTSSWLREERLEEAEKFLDRAERWCESHEKVIEIEMNDWALAEILKERLRWMKPCLGVLLHKRRKDPRMNYLKEKRWMCQKKVPGRQALSGEEQAGEAKMQNRNPEIGIFKTSNQDGEYADFYQSYLREELGIERLEKEVSLEGILSQSGQKELKQGMKRSLHLPYYQTNTSTDCPLYAQVIRGARGRQALVRECPQLCSRYTCLYPKHLKMVGRYNSLFGLDDRILRAECFPEEYETMGVDRIVLNFL